jgi:hypothetical protein
MADGWNGWGLDPPEFGRKAAMLAAQGREVEATWAGIALVGGDEEEADQLLHARRTRGMPDTGIWVGGVERFVTFLHELEGAGASWAILVPAGPRDRVELIAESVLASRPEPDGTRFPSPTWGTDQKA